MVMSTILIDWFATAIGLGFAALIVPGIKLKNVTVFLISAAVLGLINAFIRPALWFLTAPLSVLSFGLFALVINAFMIMLAAAMVPNFEVKSFSSAFLGAIIMAIIAVAGFVAMPLLSGGEIHWTSYEYHSQSHTQP
jgi:putative membrane protein